MRVRLALAAVAMACASGAQAAEPVDALAIPRFMPAVANDQTPVGPARLQLPQLNVTSGGIVRDDGSRGYRKTLVGSWSLAPAVRVGVGLFSVTRTRHKEPPLRRAQPMRDAGGRDGRLAAVGLSLNF
jgi:hypothetical protein